MELDLPTGTDGGGGDHLAKFLSTLTQLVDVLGKTSPGGTGGGEDGNTGSKNLVKATQALFNDLAAAFKPLKNVLATFGTIQPRTAPAPAVQDSDAGNDRLNDPKYDRFFNGPPTPPRPETPPALLSTPAAPLTPQAQTAEDTPLPAGALTIEDASIGIDYASVKMPAPPAPKKKPEPKVVDTTLVKSMDVDTNLVKITVPTASFKIASALLQGKFLMPPKDDAPADDTQEKNTSINKAAQNIQNAIVNIASAVVNATTAGEKKDDKDTDPKKAVTNANTQTEQDKANQTKEKTTAEPESATAAAAPKSPKMGDPKAMVLAALFKLGTSLGQAAIFAGQKIKDGAQKGADLVGSGVAAPFQEVGKKVMGGAGMLTKAFSDPLGAFKDLTSMLIGFVQVVNPATVMQFNKAIADVTAIAGKVLAPALAIATEVVREFGDIMAPIYETLTPFVTMIARAFGDMFIAMVRVSAIFMQVLLPISKSLYIALAGLARIVTALLEGVTVLLAGFLGTFDGFDGMIQKAVDAIVDFSQWLTRAAVSVAVLVAKLFGATQFIANMQKVAGNKGATNRTDSTGQAAPTMGQFTNLESFGKNIAQASFTATSVAAAPKKTDDFLATISNDINGLAQLDLKQIIVDAILKAGKDAVKETAKGAAQVAYDYNPLKRPGEAIGNFIGGMLFG